MYTNFPPHPATKVHLVEKVHKYTSSFHPAREKHANKNCPVSIGPALNLCLVKV